MSWLRIDDGFVDHPKFAGWDVRDRWALLELMTWSARLGTQGRVPDDVTTLIHRVTPRLLRRAVDSGWIDVDARGMRIHDWALYNGDLVSRVEAYCEKYPQASANEILKFTGGTRDVVLQLVRSYRKDGSDRTTKAVDKRFDPNQANGVGGGSESGTGPQPHKDQEPSVSPSRSSTTRGRAHDAGTDGLTDLSSEIEEARRALGLNGEESP